MITVSDTDNYGHVPESLLVHLVLLTWVAVAQLVFKKIF